MASIIGSLTAKNQLSKLTDVIGDDSKDNKQGELPGGLSWVWNYSPGRYNWQHAALCLLN